MSSSGAKVSTFPLLKTSCDCFETNKSAKVHKDDGLVLENKEKVIGNSYPRDIKDVLEMP